MSMILTDIGAEWILTSFFSDEAPPNDIFIELFSDSTPLTEADDIETERTMISDTLYDTWPESTTVGGTNNGNLPLSLAVGSITGGIATLYWQLDADSRTIEFEFKGPLAAGVLVTGYMITADPGTDDNGTVLDDIIICEGRLSEAFKPLVAGDILRITPTLKLGNGSITNGMTA